MATGKKFYWIKLRKDFMTGDVIDYLMSRENGAKHVVLYQMLCMMCINTDGRLSKQIGEVIIPFDTEKIYRECKYFSMEVIEDAMDVFKQLGLIYEQGGGVLAITGFEDLVGCETDYAVQKRSQRRSLGKKPDSPKSRTVEGDAGENTVASEIKKEDETITASGGTVQQSSIKTVIEAWNELQSYGVKPVLKINASSKRCQSLKARIREYSTEEVLGAINKIKQSSFLQGKNARNWVITFDWFVLPSNFPKVLEGNYDNQLNQADNGIQNQKKPGKFNQFHQRDYDMQKMERQIVAVDSGPGAV